MKFTVQDLHDQNFYLKDLINWYCHKSNQTYCSPYYKIDRKKQQQQQNYSYYNYYQKKQSPFCKRDQRKEQNQTYTQQTQMEAKKIVIHKPQTNLQQINLQIESKQQIVSENTKLQTPPDFYLKQNANENNMKHRQIANSELPDNGKLATDATYQLTTMETAFYNKISDDNIESVQFENSSEDCLVNERVQKRKRDKTHYIVMYERIEFDLVGFSLSKMRKVMMDCGAASTVKRRNDFYSFIANMAEQLSKDEYWKSRHKLGSAENWLKLKEEI